MKKIYLEPEVELIKLDAMNQLLAGSTGDIDGGDGDGEIGGGDGGDPSDPDWGGDY